MILSSKKMTTTTKKALLVELRNLLKKALDLLDTIIDDEIGEDQIDTSRELDMLLKDKQDISENELIELFVVDVLKKLGMHNNFTGYFYIKAALMLSVENKGIKNGDYEKLRITLASQYDSTPSKIERNMRTCIDKLFVDGDVETIEKVFGNSFSPITGKASTLRFLSTVTDYVLEQFKFYHLTLH